MFPSALRFTPAAAVLLLGPIASAQTAGTGGSSGGMSAGNIVVHPITIDGEDVKNDQVFLGIKECEDDATIVFDLDNVPSGKSLIDIYTGENCNATDRNNADTNPCERLTTLSTNGQTQDLQLEVSARDLFEGDCTANFENQPTLWFLAVDSGGSDEDVGQGFGTFSGEEKLRVDANRPNAPTNVTGGAGESKIRITWDTNDASLKGFRIYIDSHPTNRGEEGAGGSAASNMDAGSTTGVAEDEDGGVTVSRPRNRDAGQGSTGACGSAMLRPGELATENLDVQTKDVLRPSATGFDLPTDLIDGDRAAVAVVALDEVGNESVLSNIGCVSVEPTESFWDRFNANGGEDVAGCPCSTLGPAHVQSAWPVALALLLVRRSRRRRAS